MGRNLRLLEGVTLLLSMVAAIHAPISGQASIQLESRPAPAASSGIVPLMPGTSLRATSLCSAQTIGITLLQLQPTAMCMRAVPS